MTADRRNVIRTPWSIRLRRLVQGWPLQIVTFVLLALSVGYLWHRQGRMPNTVGRAAAPRVNVTAAVDGKLLPMYELNEGRWQPFDTVYEGQVVARLDDSDLRADLAELQQEAETLRAELAAVQFKFDADRSQEALRHHDASTQLAREVERYRLDILDRLAELEQDRLVLQRVEAQLEVVTRGRGMVGPQSLRDLQTQRDAQAALVASHARAYREAQENHRKALERLQGHPTMHDADIERVLAPLRAAITAAEARVEQMHAQIAALEVRSPISGKVVAVYGYPGQGIRSGEWILTIAAEEADHIIAYVRPEQQIRPAEGAPVGVRLRLPASSLVMTTTERVSSQWEPIPEELRLDPNRAELALPVQLAIPPGFPIQPGEVVDVTFFADQRKGI